jgi:type IV pilus assembly protein PilF
MRLRDAVVGGLLVALAMAGCSRLTFIKPNLKRHHYQQVAPDYSVRDDPRGAQRVAAIDHVALAEQQFNAGQLDQAQAEAQAAVKADPNSADAFVVLGMIAEQRGQSAVAGASYAKAVSLAPTRGTSLNNYGVWLCGSGRAKESLTLFDRAVADPGYGTPGAALANAGSCALTAGQDARALAYLQDALQLDPSNPVALAGMAEFQYRAGNYLEARAFSERRLSVAPASVQVLQLASQIEQKLGDTAAAARYVQRIGQEFPQSRPVSPGDASQR